MPSVPAPSPLTTALKPLYMWAGGKNKLLKHYAPLLPPTSEVSTYVEPFFGGGALYCYLQNLQGTTMSSTINDVNVELMGMLGELRENPDTFLQEVEELTREYLALPYVAGDKTARKDWYYKQRQAYWEQPRASLLYFLLRTGFNGIWQTCRESEGLYGTPAGLLNHQRAEQLYDAALLRSWSQCLQSTRISSGDYSQVLVPEGRGTLLFCDPPYRDSFTTYGTVFGDVEQERLCSWLLEQRERGVRVAFSNRVVAGENFFEDLLGKHFSFHYFPVTYTAGRRKREGDNYKAKPAVEFLALSS